MTNHEVSMSSALRFNTVNELELNFYSQMYQPTASVAPFLWAFSLLKECTDDESPQQELEEGPSRKSWELDTK